MNYSLSQFNKFTLSAALALAVAFVAAPAITHACGEVDMVIKKSGPVKSFHGQTIEYTIDLNQKASGLATHVVVTDEFPKGLIPVSQKELPFYIEPVPKGWPPFDTPFSCKVSGQTITCNALRFSKIQTRTLKFVF